MNAWGADVASRTAPLALGPSLAELDAQLAQALAVRDFARCEQIQAQIERLPPATAATVLAPHSPLFNFGGAGAPSDAAFNFGTTPTPLTLQAPAEVHLAISFEKRLAH